MMENLLADYTRKSLGMGKISELSCLEINFSGESGVGVPATSLFNNVFEVLT